MTTAELKIVDWALRYSHADKKAGEKAYALKDNHVAWQRSTGHPMLAELLQLAREVEAERGKKTRRATS